MTRLGAMVRGFNQGFGRGVAGFAGGAQAEQAGYDAAMQRETRLAQALAQIKAQEANAERDSALAAETRLKTDRLNARPDLYEEQAALSAGVDLPTLRAVRRSVATGQAPQIELHGPATPEGGALMGNLDIAPEVRSRIGQALMRLMPLQANTGDIKVEDWAQALGAFRNQDLGDDVLAGRRTAGAVGASQAAVAGTPLFKSDASGAVLDLFGGGLATDNPMAQSAIGLRVDQGRQARAAAAENYAQAGAANALRDQRIAETKGNTNRGGVKAPTGYRWGADGQTLEYIPGGPADPTTKGAKLAKPPTEGQAKALMFGTRMAVSDEILNELDGKYSYGAVAAAKGSDNVPIVGGITGRTAAAMLGPSGQKALQAQRDFINAILRRESGAVISAEEFGNAALQYFPQPGDKPETIRQKAANRRVAIAGMKAEFGEPLTPDFEATIRRERAARREDDRGNKPAPAAPPGWSIERER